MGSIEIDYNGVGDASGTYPVKSDPGTHLGNIFRVQLIASGQQEDNDHITVKMRVGVVLPEPRVRTPGGGGIPYETVRDARSSEILN